PEDTKLLTSLTPLPLKSALRHTSPPKVSGNSSNAIPNLGRDDSRHQPLMRISTTISQNRPEKRTRFCRTPKEGSTTTSDPSPSSSMPSNPEKTAMIFSAANSSIPTLLPPWWKNSKMLSESASTKQNASGLEDAPIWQNLPIGPPPLRQPAKPTNHPPNTM